ncbi:hypothetical protein HPB50_015329 [Hyalomma asiaticum]|uniref:Uncharacterized protein n=1 Tax=Hyalomma asiaticum TaxID=266040 RepID=A0ACB7SVS2_HYAAI|nr:hypothetical protein HPB50_015329 [Hyalomma asiaticum]
MREAWMRTRPKKAVVDFEEPTRKKRPASPSETPLARGGFFIQAAETPPAPLLSTTIDGSKTELDRPFSIRAKEDHLPDMTQSLGKSFETSETKPKRNS